MFSKFLIFITTSFLLGSAHSESAATIRNQIDSAICDKDSLRNDREDLLDDLHSLSGAWKINHQDTSSK